MRVLDWVVCVGEDVGLCCGSRLGWWAAVAQHAVTDDRLGWERLEGGGRGWERGMRIERQCMCSKGSVHVRVCMIPARCLLCMPSCCVWIEVHTCTCSSVSLGN